MGVDIHPVTAIMGNFHCGRPARGACWYTQDRICLIDPTMNT